MSEQKVIEIYIPITNKFVRLFWWDILCGKHTLICDAEDRGFLYQSWLR